MKYPTCTPKLSQALAFFLVLLFSQSGFAQIPTVTVRFANPVFNCETEQYCVDVEFQSDIEDVEIFAMNVRFFYDDEILELAGFTDFQGGYGPVAPDPPTVSMSPPGVGFSLFGFGDPGTGVADFVNGSIALVDDGQPPILLSTTEWTKLFQICFVIDDPMPDSLSFCPPLVWDLEQDPANGGFLVGDDGVVISIVDPDPMNESTPATENVVQFNWQYIGNGTPPYGEPVEIECISLFCTPTIVCAPDTIIVCTESTDILNTGSATAMEICASPIMITFSDMTIAGACAQEFTILRTWIATNTCELADTCVQTITVIDTTGPDIICPVDTLINCTESTDPLNTGMATASDNCDTAPLVTFSDVTTEGDCPQELVIARTWTAMDACGNTTTCEQTITVQDTLAPMLLCPPDTLIECDESSLPATTGFATATDNCDSAPVVDFSDTSISGSCPQTFTRIWTATDACGNSTQCAQQISIDDTTPPNLVCPPDTVIDCSEITLPVNTGTGTATDNCDSAPVVNFSDVTFAGENCGQEFTIIRLWTAMDACGNSASCFQTIMVQDTTAPDIVCPPDVTIECTDDTSSDTNGMPTATDNCTDVSDINFSINDVTIGGGCPQEYTIMRTWTALDECGNTSTCVQTLLVEDSTPPLIFCPPDATIECTESVSPDNTGIVTASDNCDPEPMVDFTDGPMMGDCPSSFERTWIATDACGNSSTCTQTIFIDDTTPPSIICPPGISVSCVSEVPAPDPTSVTTSDNCGSATVTHGGDVVSDSVCLNQLTLTRTYISTDLCGNTSTCTQIFTVNDQTPPSITCPGDVTVACASMVPAPSPGSVTVTDNCTGQIDVTHEGDVITGMNCANQFTIIRTYSASDACGNSTACVQIITVSDNMPPSITCPADVTVMCASQVPPVNTGAVATSDNCGGMVTVTHLDDVISNQTCANRFTITRTYSAMDECGNSATCAQIITVFDNTAPVVTCPPNVTIPFGSSQEPGNTGSPQVSDNCGGTPMISFNDVIIPGLCLEEFTIQRTWTATDECGNSATCLQTIEVDGNCIIDLSLTKDLVSGSPVQGGGNVKFNITVTNEGEVSISSVTITDYIPQGFILNDPAWTPGMAGSTGQSASITLSIANGGLDANGLNPGESVMVMITLQANANIPPGIYVNTAEISNVIDINGMDVSMLDIDSDADNNDLNDPPGEDDIDSAEICVLPMPVISGDGYVCPGEVETYTVNDFNPNFTYNWSLNGGGMIIQDNGSSIVVQWQNTPGGPFLITLTVVLGTNCQATAFLPVYIQGVDALACNDRVNISLGPDCEAVILSGMILEGEAEGNDNYFVVVTDLQGNVIPNATVTHEHLGQIFIVTVINECNGQSCWGTILVEDKIPPFLECRDVTIECGEPLPDQPAPSIEGYQEILYTGLNDPLDLPPGQNLVVEYQFDYSYLPINTPVLDVDVRVDMTHTWTMDVIIELVAPNGFTNIIFQVGGCGGQFPIDCIWDDEGFATGSCLDFDDGLRLQPFQFPGVAGQHLTPFDGLDASGVWTLRFRDQFPILDGGTIFEVGLAININLPPIVPTDNCGEFELTFTDTETGDPCEGLLVTRRWLATDGSGNSATCDQLITIEPVEIDSVQCPPAYIGPCHGSSHPDVTGWPTLNGSEITDDNSICNIFVGYWDKNLNDCGNGRKIVRTWTLLDWCTLEIVECVQVLKFSDDEAPEITCPANLTVGTDFWFCYANVSVPRPTVFDACGSDFTLSLTSSAGIVVNFGNNYVINQLPLGAHIVTWRATDVCGNSSTCTFVIQVVDDVVPVALCDQHTVVSLTNDGPMGITLVPAEVFDDGSYDNCGPVTFRARRMDSCIEFDWTTEGACIDDTPGGIPPVNSRDRGTVHRPCVPFACCDVGAGPVMVELEVTDASGNINYCMVEAIVQDKISPFVICPPDITVSCEFWFNVQEGTFVDGAGNNNGSLDEDPLSAVFGNMHDAFTYNDDESVRQDIIINDPNNNTISQPHFWGIDGWADDNCEVNLQVRVTVLDDCSGDDLPGNAPPGAVRLIERRFSASDGNQGVAPGTCTQRIWVVDFKPFFITDVTCFNANTQDGVIWPCDVTLTTCPEDLGNTGEPIVFDDACSIIGVAFEDTRFDFVDGACFKILRRWTIIDWCQYNSQTGAGLWHYTQVIKVHDEDGPDFVEPCVTQVLCVADPGVSLPDNNQVFLGEDNPLSSSCSVHLNLSRVVHETCSDIVKYDVKLWLNNAGAPISLQSTTTVAVDSNNNAVLSFNTRNHPNQSIRLNGIPYNSPLCGDYHRILWTVEDGCGNFSTCEYLLRLEDCKLPSPVCINGLSTVVMPIGGSVTIWAKDFDASSFDDCTPADELLFSFSGTAYEPSFTYICDSIPAFNVEIAVQIWVADGGTDDNCNGQISWSERNKDFCTTTIVITDNINACGGSGSILAGEIFTEQVDAIAKVGVTLTSPGHFFPVYVTAQDGHYEFGPVPLGGDYTITPERDDEHRNGVSTLDLVRIQKHLLGKELFTSPYQYIAADANNSLSVSAIDLIEIRKLILGIYSAFPANESWRFIEKSFPMDPEHPWPFNGEINIQDLDQDSLMNNDFIGVKIGDVNHTAKANATQILPRNGYRMLHVDLQAPESVSEGQTVDVVLSLSEIVEGFQWTLETEGLEFKGISSENLAIHDGHLGLLKEGVITMSWNAEDESSLAPEQMILMQFKATSSGRVEDMIRLTSRVTEAEAYTSQGEILEVRLGREHATPEFALYQNNPNPWNALTTIGFNLPSEGMAKLTIFDVAGKTIRTIEGEYKAGYNTVTLSVQDLPASGVLYYHLESGEYSASKKMVLMK